MKAALIPLFAEVALTIGLLVALARSRIAAVRSGSVKIGDIALGHYDSWPDLPQKLRASYQSQFELPVLFYVLIALALVTGKLDTPLVVSAWVFVATRYAHAYVHVTTNHVPTRFRCFAAGLTVMTLAWLYFATRVLLD